MQHQAKQDVYRNVKFRKHTSFPSGKQRQKKFGRGRPTAIFIASVMTAVTKTEYKRPARFASLHQLCNSPSPQLTDIVLFELSLKVFKTRLLGRDFYTLIKNVLFSSPTDVGSHNPSPFKAQRPCWHSFLSPIDVDKGNNEERISPSMA